MPRRSQHLWDLVVAEVRDECRREVARFGGRFVERPGIVGAIGCSRPLGCVVYEPDADLEWLLAQPGLGPQLLVTESCPGDDVFVEAGWTVEERLTVMVLPDAQSLVRVDAPPGFVIDPVQIPDGIDDFHDAMERGFEGGAGQAAVWLPRELIASAQPHLLVARHHDRSVGTAGWRRRVRGGVLFAIGVEPHHRGVGLGSSLTAAASIAAFRAGAAFVTLMATEAGHGVYERVGFKVAGKVTSYAPARPPRRGA